MSESRIPHVASQSFLACTATMRFVYPGSTPDHEQGGTGRAMRDFVPPASTGFNVNSGAVAGYSSHVQRLKSPDSGQNHQRCGFTGGSCAEY